MFNHLLSICLVGLFSFTAMAAKLDSAERIWKSSSGASSWRKVIIELVNEGYPFSAITLMKDYLVQNRSSLDEDLDEAFDQIITAAGVRPFETLPENVLKQSKSPIVRYILAKKNFRRGNMAQALKELERIGSGHPIYPFAIHLQASINSILGKKAQAASDFEACVSASRSRYNGESNPVKLRQLLINRDSCLAGVARAAFNAGDYTKADFLYLDVQKSSYIWPDILFEEAWTSYYLKNYNRTLGKLVSYKSPVLSFIFNPEIDVLRSLAYMRLCLYDDVNTIVEDFYKSWEKPADNLKSYLNLHGRDYGFYFKAVTEFEKERRAPDFLQQSIFTAISRDAAWQEMKQAYIDSIKEFTKLKGEKSRFSVTLMKNVKQVAADYQELLGSYARSQFHEKYQTLSNSFEGMSFIKLEVLSRRKQSLYDDKKSNRSRGDIRYLQRNDKQYFWSFNGEFWADELGDYVFALRSEC